MGAGQKFVQFALDVGRKIHDLENDTIKVMLTNVAPVGTNAVKADITEIAAGNGYTAGGVDTQATWALVAGVATLVCVDATITASGGDIGPFRWLVAYNATPAAGPLVMFWDIGAPQTVTAGNAVKLDFAANTVTLV